MNRTFRLKVWRDLRAAWAQNLALVVVAALGVASFVALVGSFRDLDSSYTRTYDELAFADVDLRVDQAPAAVLDEVAAVEGVAAVTGRFILDAGFELADGEQVRSRLIGVPAGPQPAVNRLLIAAGSFLPAEGGRVAVLEATFAAARGISVGDTIKPILNGEAVPLLVSGLANSPEYLIISPSKQDIFPAPSTFAVVFLPLETLQGLTGRSDTLNDIAVRVTAGADRAAVIADLQALLAPYGLESTTPREENPSNAALQQDISAFEDLSVLMPALILIVAAISVYVMLGRMVRGQQPLIGLMKALGYSDGAVLRHYLTFAWVIGGLGLVLGTALGILLASFLTGEYAAELGIPLVETRFYPDLPLIALGLSAVLFTLAGYGPARTSARMAPAEAMRQDPNVANNVHGAALPERIVRLPLGLRLPLRNVFRQRRRSATTGLGIIFSFMLVLMVWGILDSMTFYLRQTFEDVELWDAAALFETPQTASTLEEVRSWEGVRAADPFAQLPATITVADHREDVLLTAFDPEQQMHVLNLTGSPTASDALAEGKVILTAAMAGVLGVDVGDSVTVQTPLGTESLVVGGLADELISSVIYVNLNEVAGALPVGGPLFNGIYLQVDAARLSQVEDALYHLPGAAGVQLKQDLRSDLEDLMGLFYLFMGIMLAFALAMAFALLFNAMTVNVLERQRELATMRAIGTSRGGVARLLLTENVVLWLLVLIPGLLLGTWAAGQMANSFSADFFAFNIVIAPLSYLLTAVGVLLTMMLATWPAVRRVNRLNLAEATKVLT